MKSDEQTLTFSQQPGLSGEFVEYPQNYQPTAKYGAEVHLTTFVSIP
jgi:hypothetical protein